MPNSETIVQCSNPSCLKSNTLATRFCQRCRTPIIKRYLWAIHLKSGSSQEQESTLQESWRGELASTVDPFMAEADLGDRYLAFGDRVFLDTQPATKPQTVENLPPEIVNYLQLFDCYPHVPRVYGQLDNTDLWLLEYGTVPVNSSGEPIHPELLPRLDSLWKETSPCKQLTWLIQLAYLWQPLEQKSLTATAIAPELIRINGSLVQFIELRQNQDTAPTLIDLGKLWQQWAQQAQPEIQEVLIELSQRMASGALAKISEVISVLDRALELCSQSQEYSSEIYSISESGPRRKNNQDRAYPDSLMPTKVAGESHSLAIVCDGVGGHDGGEVVLVLHHQLEPAAQDAGALLGGARGPALLGVVGRVDGLGGLGAGAVRHLGHDVAARGVVDGEGRPLHPLASEVGAGLQERGVRQARCEIGAL